MPLADKVLSTEGILKHCRDSETSVHRGDGVGILHRLQKESPKKVFFPAAEERPASS